MTVREEFLQKAHGNPVHAAVLLAEGLMASDPATCKLGWDLEAASLRASEMFEVDIQDVQTVINRRLASVPLTQTQPAVTRYLVKVYGDIEPEIDGPFTTDEERDEEALRFRKTEGIDNGIYTLNVAADGKPEINAYRGGFFEPLKCRSCGGTEDNHPARCESFEG